MSKTGKVRFLSVITLATGGKDLAWTELNFDLYSETEGVCREQVMDQENQESQQLQSLGGCTRGLGPVSADWRFSEIGRCPLMGQEDRGSVLWCGWGGQIYLFVVYLSFLRWTLETGRESSYQWGLELLETILRLVLVLRDQGWGCSEERADGAWLHQAKKSSYVNGKCILVQSQ